MVIKKSIQIVILILILFLGWQVARDEALGQSQCTADSHCPAGQFCYNYQCHSPECQTDADCGEGYFCYLRMCYLEDTCYGASVPDTSGVCDGQTCSGSPPGENCTCDCWPKTRCQETCVRLYCGNEVCQEWGQPECVCSWSCPPSKPTPTPHPTLPLEPTATPRPTNTPTPSPSPTATPSPTPTPTSTPTATPLPTATPTPIPTATPTREPPASCACWLLEAEGNPNLTNIKRGQLLSFLAEAYVATPDTAKVLEMIFVLQRPTTTTVESGPIPAYFNRSEVINGVNTDVYRAAWAYRVQTSDPEGIYYLKLIINCGWKTGTTDPSLPAFAQTLQFRVLGETLATPTPTLISAQSQSFFTRWLTSLLEFLGLRRPEAAKIVAPTDQETLKIGTFFPEQTLPERGCTDLYFRVVK